MDAYTPRAASRGPGGRVGTFSGVPQARAGREWAPPCRSVRARRERPARPSHARRDAAEPDGLAGRRRQPEPEPESEPEAEGEGARAGVTSRRGAGRGGARVCGRSRRPRHLASRAEGRRDSHFFHLSSPRFSFSLIREPEQRPRNGFSCQFNVEAPLISKKKKIKTMTKASV